MTDTNSKAQVTDAETLARQIWGYFRGDSTGGTTAMQWFDNNKSLGGPAHIINLCRSALAAQEKPEPGVAVKALEWERVVGDVYVAGSYKIDRMRPLLSGKPKKYFVQIALGFGFQTVSTLCPTLEAAKAAAQADYEQRIRSALAAPSPDLPKGEVETIRQRTIEECAKVADAELAKHNTGSGFDSQPAYSAAFAIAAAIRSLGKEGSGE